ncbi:peroxidase family protein [Marinibaculum pumilum]|uniref:Peroxidase family protein n=1 Tax=Marinibaculum pumilum TaxID=1766165 RepID=A0ABV7KUB4_9PROT
MPDILDTLAGRTGGSLSHALFGRGRGGRDDEDRAIDGSGNNPRDADLGAAGTTFTSSLAPGYADGFDSPSGADRPNARTVSNEIFAQDAVIDSAAGTSNLFWMWGQFLDHDIDLTEAGSSEDFSIAVPTGDAWFDPYGTGTQSIAMTRSAAAEGTGTGAGNPRLQVNEITAFVDASNVYGSDTARAAALRADGGYLKVSDGDLLPYNTGGFDNANANPFLTDAELFLAGDVRANENVGLTAMHTIFVREHNRIVDELGARFPSASADELYEGAKAIVEAEIQAVTYNEFLPLLVGSRALGDWHGYRPDIDPQIASEFATAAFRIGHSMLSGTLARMTESGAEAAAGDLALRDAFFNPAALASDGIDNVLRGQAATFSQEIDTQVVDDVRNFLFGPPGSGGFDLVSLNIQRGRDHGLTDYNSVREAYGLGRVSSFAEITSDTGLAARLQATYGSVDRLDLYVGGLAEDHAAGALVGETFQAILVAQFAALRDGDRFWYEGRLSRDLVAQINATSLSDIILRNTDIDHLQDDVFLASNRVGGSDGAESLSGSGGRDLMMGLGGDDLLSGDAGNDRLLGGDGLDTLLGGDGADWLQAEGGNDSLDGGLGGDSLYGNGGDDSLSGGDGADMLHGGVGADSLDGGADGDLMVGMWQDDSLSGGSGDDSLYGNIGNDILAGGDGADMLHGGSGSDTLSGEAGDDRLIGLWDDDRLWGGAGNDSLYGNPGDDWLAGGEGADMLHGGAGRDTLQGGAGDDTLIGLFDDDSLSGGAGADMLAGNHGDDSLAGEAGADRLHGGMGSDLLDGGDGDDSLFAFEGGDTLTGGSGADRFVHQRGGGHAVTDYDAGEGDMLMFDQGIGPVSVTVSGSSLLVTDMRGTQLFTVEELTDPNLLNIGYL